MRVAGGWLAFGIATLVVACGNDVPSLTPDVIRESEWATRQLEVRGLHPTIYMTAVGDELRLREDLEIEVGGVAAEVLDANGAGIRIRLSAPLAVGTHDLTVRAIGVHERADALRVVPDDFFQDAGEAGAGDAGDTGDAGMDGGTDASADSSADTTIADAGTPTLLLRLGGFSTYMLRVDGTMTACGANDVGQLALGDLTNRTTPTRVGLRSDWLLVAAGATGVLGMTATGELHGSGANDFGQLGLDDEVARSSFGVTTLPVAFSTLDFFTEHACAVGVDGGLYCWGRGLGGRLGTGDMTDHSSPVRIGSGAEWVRVAVNEASSFATRRDGTLWGWGGVTSTTTPMQIGVGTDWTAVDAGRNFQCGLRGAGELWCWGVNGNGELGLGDRMVRTAPERVGLRSDWTQLGIGRDHTCAIAAGELWCWGANRHGQLGVGDTTARTTPARVGSGADWLSVASGYQHTCGHHGGSSLECWGINRAGQLGTGDTVPSTVPVPMLP